MGFAVPPVLSGVPGADAGASTCILGLLVPLGMTYIFAPQLVCWGALRCGGGPGFPSEGFL